jgi:arylsulfatase A-like enzyme
VRLPGDSGAIVRVGLQVGGGSSERYAWGVWRAPRILGRGIADSLIAAPFTPAEDGRATALRKALAGANVLLVILDAARAQEFGTYGYTRATTPQIDSIAAEGVVFENAFTPAVYTLAAMPSIWTSQHPDRHHSEVSFSARLPKDRLTLAELLSVRGIATTAFVANAVAGRAFGFDRGFAEFNEYFHRRAEVFREVVPPWLRANRDKRFFAYLHFREPHFPYDPAPPFDTMFGAGGPITPALRGDAEYLKDVNQGRRPFGAEEAAHLVRLYDGNLAYADQEVGAVRKALEAEGLWDKTVVIVAADHGEALHEHGWIGHNVQLYEESIHIPLIVRFPAGTGPAGKRIKALADLLDLAPTIADVFGALGQGGSDREFQGRSLLPVIEGAPGKPAVLSRTVWDRPIYAVRDERFKLLYNTRTGETALYDLSEDPRESRDASAREPLRAAYYREALHHWIAQLAERTRLSGEEARPTPEQCENLRSLGYADARCK